LLIPPYDEYLIGYKSRDIVLPQEHRHKAHNNSGIFQPIVALDGVICGNWKPFKEEFQVEFFDGGHAEEEVRDAWQAYQQFKKSDRLGFDNKTIPIFVGKSIIKI
ncbi:MAG: winged helix DNA-binding domain-containing protein, partial [Bacteroidales bacterium]|nr:winged helix DNA-binding domain-containing protein [Bacteroidales bacterium]